MLMRTSGLCSKPRNQFLRHLSEEDDSLLSAQLEQVCIEPGALLMRMGETIDTIYFPESVVVSIGRPVSGHSHIETAIVGSEGMIGWSSFAKGPAGYNARTQMAAGIAWRTPVRAFAEACLASRTLQAAVMRFAEVITIQMAQAIVSHLRDPVERRVCRWILMRHDRVLTDQLLIRHEEISDTLGIRRASVTDALHILEGERLIRCHRGRLVIRNRRGLEGLAGESYGVAEACYRDQIGPLARSQAH